MIEAQTYTSGLAYAPTLNAAQLPVSKEQNDKAAALSFEEFLNAPPVAASAPQAPLVKTEAATPPSSTAVSAVNAPDETDGGFMGFLKAIVDVINPLQHIPVISALYRHVTGDEISSVARVAGGALYGGVMGAAVGLVDVAVEKVTGDDMGETAIALLMPDKKAPAAENNTILAAATPAQKEDEIIWDTQMAALSPNRFSPDFSSGRTPTQAYRTGPGEKEPATYSTPIAPPVPHKEGTEADIRKLTALGLTASGTGSTNVLHLQEAPATAHRTGAAPEPIVEGDFMMPPLPVEPVEKERIAAKMAEALDKYTALKRVY